MVDNFPSPDCPNCPRLVAFRHQNILKFPTYHNAPVPPFGALDAPRLIIGLAPGLHGANQTGRPFTGDYAGDTLYSALKKHGLASGEYARHAQDGLILHGVRITNAVRCVPPENKPETIEINICNHYLTNELSLMPHLRVMLVLGNIAHKATLKALGLKSSVYPFKHGASYHLPNGKRLLCSYHCSRYNTNTGRLTETMFDEIIRQLGHL